MKYRKAALSLLFSIVVLGVGSVTNASAQRHRNAGHRNHRPVIIRRYIVRDPFWFHRGWGGPFYGYSRFYAPYRAYEDRREYLESRVRGNRSELDKHLAKYNEDGVITAKEQRELDDDYRDVRNSVDALQRFLRNY